MVTRREFALSIATLAVGASGCLEGISGGDDGSNGGSGGGVDAPPTRERASPLAVSYDTYEDEAQDVLRKDGIPSIDKPEFHEGDELDGIPVEDGDPVFGVVRNGDVRAYPQDILAQHEIVNDTVGGDNVSVTYCPLTGTAIGFERGDTTLGVSGNLVNSNLIMYDRATESRFPQILGAAKSGPLRDKSLVEFEVTWTTWGRWRDEHPDTVVLPRDSTGALRNYDNDPYGGYNPRSGYYDNDNILFPVIHEDDRYHPKKVFMGARDADNAVAFDKDRLREEGELTIETDEGDYAATYDEALDTATVERDGEPLVAFDAMWFAWYAFFPDTHVA